jgi:hypothetical protein
MGRVIIFSPSSSDGRQHIHSDATRRPCPSYAYSMISGKQLMPTTLCCWSYSSKKFSIFLYPPNVYRSSLVYDGRNWSELFWFVEIHIQNFHFIPRVSYLCFSLLSNSFWVLLNQSVCSCWTNVFCSMESQQYAPDSNVYGWLVLPVNLCVKHVNQMRNFG